MTSTTMQPFSEQCVALVYCLHVLGQRAKGAPAHVHKSASGNLPQLRIVHLLARRVAHEKA